MNEHHKLDCGCMWKAVACRCDYAPHEPHKILVSPCPKHIKRVGEIIDDWEAFLRSAADDDFGVPF